jgi:hypothetical protein
MFVRFGDESENAAKVRALESVLLRDLEPLTAIRLETGYRLRKFGDKVDRLILCPRS